MLDADIRDFFGQLDRDWLRKFLGHRIADKRVLRLIGKWLAAGVIEDGNGAECDQGSPQGHRYRRCSPTCTCTTSWTCGLTGGGAGSRTVT